MTSVKDVLLWWNGISTNIEHFLRGDDVDEAFTSLVKAIEGGREKGQEEEQENQVV